MLLALALLGVVAGPANATSYSFVISESAVQTALANRINAVFGGGSDPLFAAYEILLRPAVATDANPPFNSPLSNYTLTGSGSPIPTSINGDRWDTTVNITDLHDPGHLLARYEFYDSDTVLSMVTTNANVGGKVYQNPVLTNQSITGAQMPGSDNFTIEFSSTDPNVTGTVQFWLAAYALQFSDASAGSIAAKASFIGNAFLTATGSVATPEPSALPLAGSGLALLLAALLRRRNRARTTTC